jgi:D-alanyl-D-alanine carboxypeptidase/D-alanyl-D-alanine-endopeptidase (penicillin-binding protein 4)
MKLRYTIILLFCSSILIFSRNPVEDFAKSPLLENANVSLLVNELETGKTLYQFRPKSVATPASTMKLITTTTALELLGPDFQFQTKLEIVGTLLSDSTLNGDLYIRGGGDPTLGSDKFGDKPFLPQWVMAVKNAGIKCITGRIIADISIFESQVINPKWTWQDMGNYYAPGIHGISYMDNTFKMIFRSGKIGTTPEILRTQPEISDLKVNNQIKSTSINYDNAYFYGAPFSYDRSIYGEIPANRSEFIVKGDIPNPGLLLAQHFQKCLSDSGVIVQNFPLVEFNSTNNGTIIYNHFSPTLRDIISETNIKSNNHFAEYIFKYISTLNSKVGTNTNAINIIREFWKTKGLPVDQLFQFDGSGLSPCDMVSANFYVELLTYMRNKSKYSDDFFKSLPISGGKGTLSTLLLNTSLEGKVHAKSGTIEGVKCYAGYIELKNRTLVFALMVNNPNGTSKEVVRKMEDFLLDISK